MAGWEQMYQSSQQDPEAIKQQIMLIPDQQDRELALQMLESGENPLAQDAPAPTPQAEAPPSQQGMHGPMSQTAVPPAVKRNDLADQMQESVNRLLNQQEQGLEKQQAGVQQVRQTPERIDWSPLANYVATLSPDNAQIARGYKAPQSAEERALTIQKLENELQNNREGITKSQIDALKARVGAPLEEAKLKMYEALANSRNQMMGLRADTLTNRVVNDVNHDKTLQDLNAQKITIDRGIHTIENSQVLAPQTLAELESEISKALAGKGMVAEGSIHRQTMMTAARQIAELRQQYGNQPIDMRKVSPQIVQYIQDTMKRLQEAYQGAMNDRAEQISKGKSFSNQQVQKGLQDAVGGYKKEIGSPLGTQTTDKSGQVWKKTKNGSDSDKNNWSKQ